MIVRAITQVPVGAGGRTYLVILSKILNHYNLLPMLLIS
jgi:hypothetical protein